VLSRSSDTANNINEIIGGQPLATNHWPAEANGPIKCLEPKFNKASWLRHHTGSFGKVTFAD
jgi:hypothetical protein